MVWPAAFSFLAAEVVDRPDAIGRGRKPVDGKKEVQRVARHGLVRGHLPAVDRCAMCWSAAARPGREFKGKGNHEAEQAAAKHVYQQPIRRCDDRVAGHVEAEADASAQQRAED